MFRLLRTALLVVLAFVAGILYERFNDDINCDNKGGQMSQGLCVGASR
jgi:hypothetical protein